MQLFWKLFFYAILVPLFVKMLQKCMQKSPFIEFILLFRLYLSDVPVVVFPFALS
jgi:hypothetical protein